MAKPRKKVQDAGDNGNGGTAVAMPPATAPQFVGDTTAASNDRDRIARRAYELYLARGGNDGGAMEDWLTAERELRQDTREP
jgi:hypothetical protein